MQQYYAVAPPGQPHAIPHSSGTSFESTGHLAHAESGRQDVDISSLTSNQALVRGLNDSPHPESNPFSASNSIMDDWLYSPNPWNHIQGRKEVLSRSDSPASTLYYQQGVPSFQGCQGSIEESDCETTGPRPLPSDSGYESIGRSQQNALNGSIYDDFNHLGLDTASVVSGPADSPYERPPIPLPNCQSPVDSQSTQTNGSVDGDGKICRTCRVQVKTKSELKKHKRRHEKPYRCDVPGCTRTDGFSTTNDVDRHKKSRHPDHVSGAKFFRCTVEGCRYPFKKWPRADNFRQHLKRVHSIVVGENELEQYTYKSPELSSPPELVGLGGDASALNHQGARWPTLEDIQEECLMEDFPEIVVDDQQLFPGLDSADAPNDLPDTILDISPTEPMSQSDILPVTESLSIWQTSRNFSDQEQNGEFVQFQDEPSIYHDNDYESIDFAILYDEPGQTGQNQADKNTRSAYQPTSQISRNSSVEPEHSNVPITDNVLKDSTPSGHDDIDDPSASISPTTVHLGGSLSATPADKENAIQVQKVTVDPHVVDTSDIINDDRKVASIIKALQEKGTLTEFLDKLGYHSAQVKDSNTTIEVSDHSNSVENTLMCQEPGCAKKFLRPCELKKHEKRHTKPYACTFHLCGKRFGSKNDWKRHENSQHYQHELWKCDEKKGSGLDDVCGKISHRREQFKAHLMKDHQTAIIEAKLHQCRFIVYCDPRFWCGFCKKYIQVEEDGWMGWVTRINHIDDHYSGRGCPKMDISQWENDAAVRSEVNPQSSQLTTSSTNGHSADFHMAPLSGARGTRKVSKRSASDEVEHQRPRKKGRALMFYCCGCYNQLETLSQVCLTPDCNGHQRCDNCSSEVRQRSG